MTKWVFVVMRDNDGEDRTELEGVYLSREQANKVAEELQAEDYHGVEVYMTAMIEE